MLELGSTYLITKNFEESIRFYEAVLQMKVSTQNFNRWAQFNVGNNCIALYNPEYDNAILKSDRDHSEMYDKNYLDYLEHRYTQYGNNFVLNFYTENLLDEYNRLMKLEICKPSKIMKINIKAPYYFFTINDPDGNIIEITGEYRDE